MSHYAFVPHRSRFREAFAITLLLGAALTHAQTCYDGIGAVLKDGWPYGFMLSADGGLWSISQDDYLVELGRPSPTVSIVDGVGVVSRRRDDYDGQRIYVFVRGSDGHLWLNAEGPTRSTWYDEGQPSADVTVDQPVGVVTVRTATGANDRPFVFVQGSDKNLWLYSKATSGGWDWTDEGRPKPHVKVAGPIGVGTFTDFITGGHYPYVFIRGSDGHLWMRSYKGGSWKWTDYKQPKTSEPSVSVSGAIGVVTETIDNPGTFIPEQRPCVFVQGSDSNVWYNRGPTDDRKWKNNRTPEEGTKVSRSFGVAMIRNIPYAFIQDSEGLVWTNWDSADIEGTQPGTKYVNWDPFYATASKAIGVATEAKPSAETAYMFFFDTQAHVVMSERRELGFGTWKELSMPASVVNMIPAVLSGETNQDSEPFLSVNPSNNKRMIGSAFTPNPDTQSNLAPIYFSIDCGRSWSLNNIIPSVIDSKYGTADITHSYNGSGGSFYAAILTLPRASPFPYLRLKTDYPTLPIEMEAQGRADYTDQPFVRATTIDNMDRILIGRDDQQPDENNTNYFRSTVDVSADAGFTYRPAYLDPDGERSDDGTPTRIAIAQDNKTVYAAYFKYTGPLTENKSFPANVMVVRDDEGGAPDPPARPFDALPGGVSVADNVQITFTQADNSPNLGGQRIGSALSIAVSPLDPKIVYIAWGDRTDDSIITLHLRMSLDAGVTWSRDDIAFIPNATNCALAVGEKALLGFLYQRVLGDRWVTALKQFSYDRLCASTVLADVPLNTPEAKSQPYIGDYVFLLAAGHEFRGVFSAGNTPVKTNFPSGVHYQRNVNFDTQTLLDENGNQVDISIDPFYFSVPMTRCWW